MSGVEAIVQTLADRIKSHAGTIQTEEAAKTSVILPFLQALGFDIFDPSEVIPEFTADAVGKKGEKVDYAIKINGKIGILVECKSLGTKLERKHLSQLFKFFTVTDAKFAILTNAQAYEFYTDLEEPNKLDSRPFFVFDLLDANAGALSEVKKFEKSVFNIPGILATAERLKFVSAIKKFLAAQFEQPTEDLVKLIAAEVHEGRSTAQIRTMVESATKAAFKELVRDSVQARLSSALETTNAKEPEDDATGFEPEGEVVTTPDEIEGMMTIKSIVRDLIDVRRVGLRDGKSYCAVLVDDNNRKPLARMHFNRKQWFLGLLDGEVEERIAISGLHEIYDLSERLREMAKRYAP